MEVSSPSPVRDVVGRMRRLSEAIDDPDSSVAQRTRWTGEYVDLAGSLVGEVGARAASGSQLLDLAARRPELPDGRTDLYL